MVKTKQLSKGKPMDLKKTLFMAILVGFALVGAYSVGSSFAAKRTRVTLSIPNGTYASTTTATVTGASTSSGQVWVVANCLQNGNPVIFNRVQIAADSSSVTLTLGPTDGYKTGQGGATCSAEAKEWNLKRQKWVYLAETTFIVTD